MKMTIYFGLLLLVSTDSWGYELPTHSRITNAAYSRSVIFGDSTLINDLGLIRYVNGSSAIISNPRLGETYYDVSGTLIYARQNIEFSVDNMPNISDVLSIQGWLMRGVIREDDVPWPSGDRAPWVG